jgi:hypothetical protein
VVVGATVTVKPGLVMLAAVAVMLEVPAATPVTTPVVEATVACAVVPLAQVAAFPWESADGPVQFVGEGAPPPL